MEITKTVKLRARRYKDTIICSDRPTLQIVLGTSSPDANPSRYRYEKKDKEFWVPISSIKAKIALNQAQIENLKARIDIMKQVIK